MKSKLLTIIALSTVCLTGCTGNFEKINTNPTTINYGAIKPSNMFEPILFETGKRNQYYAWFWNNELVQTTAFTGGSTRQEHLYLITDGNAQTIWDDFARRGADTEHMIQLSLKEKDEFFHGVGLVLKCWQMAELTQLFGDIPYSEAFQYSANRYPKFESQEQVFENIIRDLDSAAVILSHKPTSGYSNLDQMYNADTGLWRRFANSLKLRYMCRLTGMSDAYWTRIQEILDNPSKYPIFRSNADNAAVPFQGVDPYKSYWGAAETTKSVFQQHRLTQQFIKMTTELDTQGNELYKDPRLGIWGVQTNGKWKGTVSGGDPVNRNTDDAGTAKPNFEILGAPNLSGFLMDYSEILFIEAEGVLKGKLTVGEKTAEELYEEAVRASMEKWSPYGQLLSKPLTFAKADVDKYLASSLGSWSQAGEEGSIYGSKEEFLMAQKWLSLMWVGWEQYHEWRRTEYPVLTIGDGTTFNEHELPTRFIYPAYTISSNSENVSSAIYRMGGANDMHLALDWTYKKRNGGNRHPYGSK